jgi:hypothetical protein
MAYNLTASATSSPDLAVNIVPDAPVKPQQPVQPAAPVGRAKAFWANKRNRWLTAAAVLVVVAVPCIVAPIVVTQQNKNAQNESSALDANGQELSLASGSGVDATMSADGALRNPLIKRNGTANGTLTNATYLYEEEAVSPFIGIRNGVVRGRPMAGMLLAWCSDPARGAPRAPRPACWWGRPTSWPGMLQAV